MAIDEGAWKVLRFKLSPSERRTMMRAMGLLGHVGLTMVVCVVGCILFGKWLDEQLGTAPVFLLIFIVLGAASAIFSLYKIVMDSMK